MNKTIYIRKEDVPLWNQAHEIADGKISRSS